MSVHPARRRAGGLSTGRTCSSNFRNVYRKDVREPAKPRIPAQILAHVVQGARNVLNVNRILPRGRLIAEGAERLEIALQRHQVEASSKLLRLRRSAALKRQEIRNQ